MYAPAPAQSHHKLHNTTWIERFAYHHRVFVVDSMPDQRLIKFSLFSTFLMCSFITQQVIIGVGFISSLWSESNWVRAQPYHKLLSFDLRKFVFFFVTSLLCIEKYVCKWSTLPAVIFSRPFFSTRFIFYSVDDAMNDIFQLNFNLSFTSIISHYVPMYYHGSIFTTIPIDNRLDVWVKFFVDFCDSQFSVEVFSISSAAIANESSLS